jgi:hypothetical protein
VLFIINTCQIFKRKINKIKNIFGHRILSLFMLDVCVYIRMYVRIYVLESAVIVYLRSLKLNRRYHVASKLNIFGVLSPLRCMFPWRSGLSYSQAP